MPSGKLVVGEKQLNDCAKPVSEVMELLTWQCKLFSYKKGTYPRWAEMSIGLIWHLH